MRPATKPLDRNDAPNRCFAWSTRGLTGRTALDAWREQLSRLALPMRVEASVSGFRASLRLRPFGPITLVEAQGSAQRLVRGAPQIDAEARGVCFVSTMTRSVGWLETDRGRSGGQSGTVTYAAGDTPFTLEFKSDFAFVSAMIPAQDMEALAPRSALAHGGQIAPPAGPAVGALLTALTAQAGPVEMENRLYTHFLGIAAAGIDAGLEPEAQTRAERDRLLLGRIKADLATRLADPVRTDAAALAARFNLSPRKVQRLFQAEGETANGWLTGQRLARCARDLRDPRLENRTITQIALGWGFSDMGRFSRAFRDRYGVSPSRWRAAPSPAAGPSSHPATRATVRP